MVLTRNKSMIYGLDSDLLALQNKDTALQTEIDATQTGAGLGIDGAYTANTSANYIAGATSLKDADDKLDARLKLEKDERLAAANNSQAEIDAIEAGAGLEADGTYTANGAANYISTATSLKVADNLLDAQAKVNADGLAQEIIDRTNAIADLSGVSDAPTARTNLDVYSKGEVASAITEAGLNLGTNYSTQDAASAAVDFGAGSLSVGDNLFIVDDGDTKWAIYKIIAVTDGAYSTSTLEKIMDEDVYLNAQSKETIKVTYESNADTNAFTDEALARSGRIGDSTTVLNTTATEILAAINEVDANADAAQAELDVTQTGAGLEADGTYTVNAGANYIASAASLKDADDKLDTALKTEETTRVNAIADLSGVTDAATARTNLDVYSKGETDEAIRLGGAIFTTESLLVTSDKIVLTNAPKNGVIYNFATVRHIDVVGVAHDIPVTVTATAGGKEFLLSPNTTGQFDGKNVTIQYAYVPVA